MSSVTYNETTLEFALIELEALAERSKNLLRPPLKYICKGLVLEVLLPSGGVYKCRRCSWDGEITSLLGGDGICPACDYKADDQVVEGLEVVPVSACLVFIPNLNMWQLVQLPEEEEV